MIYTITQDNQDRDLVLRRKKEKSLDYNNSFLGEYECSSLTLDREEMRKKRLDHLKQDQTMQENPTITVDGPGDPRYIWGPLCLSGVVASGLICSVASFRSSMAIMRFHCPFVGLSGCHDGGGNGLTKTSLITHLRDRHCNGDAQATTKHALLTDLVVFEKAEANKRQRQKESITNAIRSWGVPCGSWQLVRETLIESASPMLDLDEENLDLSEQNLKQCKRKICDSHYTAVVRVLSSSGVAPYNDAILQIKSFPRGTSCGRDGLRAQHLMDCLSGAVVAISDELVSSITQVVNLFLEGKCPMMLGEYIASAPLTPLIKPGGGIRPIVVGTVWRRLVSKDREDDVGISMLLVDFQNAFNLNSATLALPDCTKENTFCGHAKGCNRVWYLDDGTIVGDTLVVGKEDPRSRLEGVFPPNISRPLHGVKLLGGPVSVDADFSSALVMKRVSKTIGLLDTVAKINDPQCELLLIRACAGISKLYFAMRTCPPHVFESAQLSFDMALRSALERDVLNYAFIASRLQSTALQTKLLRHVDIVAIGSTFDDALCMFNNAMGIDFLSNSSQVAAPKLMKKMADIYFTQVTKDVKSSFCLSPRQMALWQSQREEHTSDWLRVVPISGLGQTMNGKTYRCVLCYRLGVPLFSVSKPCSACSKVFTGDVYGDHVVSCAGVIGISAGKEVDIGLGGGCAKALRPADMLLYSWEGGLDVCVDLTGSSPLTQTGMADFVPGRAVIDATQRKRVKYMTKCADIGYGFLHFLFSSFGELEKDAVTLLKRVRKFSMAQDIGGRAAVHIFNRIGFSIANGVGAQIVYRLPSNLL
ncbi:hypothetical protein Tco_1541046 [Tanacetum coccineum]